MSIIPVTVEHHHHETHPRGEAHRGPPREDTTRHTTRDTTRRTIREIAGETHGRDHVTHHEKRRDTTRHTIRETTRDHRRPYHENERARMEVEIQDIRNLETSNSSGPASSHASSSRSGGGSDRSRPLSKLADAIILGGSNHVEMATFATEQAVKCALLIFHSPLLSALVQLAPAALPFPSASSRCDQRVQFVDVLEHVSDAEGRMELRRQGSHSSNASCIHFFSFQVVIPLPYLIQANQVE